LENPEKRRYRRVEFKALLHSLIHRPADVSIKIIGNDTKVVMLDLSEDGMAIESSYFVPIGTIPLIKFDLLTKDKNNNVAMRKIIVEGRIANKEMLKEKGYRLGIQFMKISSEDKAIISGFVKVAFSD